MNIIKRKKRLDRNIFHIKITQEEIFNFSVFVLTLSAFYEVMLQIMDDPLIVMGVSVGLYIFALICNEYYKRVEKVKPYEMSKHFIGLYSIEGAKPIEADFDNGLISREDEVRYIDELLKTIWGQEEHKRGICLVGASGCGKSTIINLLEYGKYRKTKDKYDIYNFSDKYDFLEEYIKNTFAKDYVADIQESPRNIVIICDQFERYFSLEPEQKKMVKQCIKKLSLPNVAIIFSLREEYFLPFLYDFDINDLNMENELEPDFNGTIAYKKYLTGKDKGVFEDNNILVCFGEENYSGTDHKEMLRLCIQAFHKEKGKMIYGHFKDATLIQQQIIFNILENEKNYIASERFWKWDINSMMKRYFDVQLCSTEDFFNASRIMYLLSIGRNNGIAFTDEDLEAALCIFTQDEKDDFHVCLEELHKLRLIKKAKHNDTGSYEVSHDYIAQSFEVYASTEIPSNVKIALDEYRSEYVRKIDIKKKIETYEKEQKKPLVAVGVV